MNLVHVINQFAVVALKPLTIINEIITPAAKITAIQFIATMHGYKWQ